MKKLFLLALAVGLTSCNHGIRIKAYSQEQCDSLANNEVVKHYDNPNSYAKVVAWNFEKDLVTSDGDCYIFYAIDEL